ncbi:MAG: 4-oxalocrotonate tautomerase family protein [Candidatus Omnitrophica bacterium]|jgi:4-oxalocrotonate tautomerase|nr:4-oxalocrotonate tautomerase family protein [Candidatus Omnitrophota bacterium]
MPYIHLQVGGKLTPEQKSQIAKEFSDTLLKVAGKPKKATYLVIEEVSRDNWAIGDDFLSSNK